METPNRTELDFAADLDFSEILTNPILDIAARFWEDDRYEAFRICYRSMRTIDDLVDSQKATGRELSEQEQALFASMIDDWINSLRRCRPADRFQEQLIETIDRFAIPIWPWERLARAMTYDLYHYGFASFHLFLRYAEGAAIAPASIFMHLCGIRNDGGLIAPPLFDIRLAARPLALFSYLVHIMRDFQKDQNEHLNYFADNILQQEGADVSLLREAAKTGKPSPPVRDVFSAYHRLAERYRVWSREMLDDTLPKLQSRYQLSLEVIYGLYLQIYQRVNVFSGTFTSPELNPDPDQVKKELDRIIADFRPTES